MVILLVAIIQITTCGLRPIVALKSNIKLIRQEDGTFTIFGNTEKRTASTITTDDYGVYVTNYASSDSAAQQSVGWRIFHSDGENIYLIADNYVEKQYIPKGRNNTSVTFGSKSKTFAYTNVSNDYVGTEDLSSSIIANKWLSKYLNLGYTSTYPNMKATAYLLDTSVWNPGFANSYAEYAIGGPTLELFAASYNATHTTDINVNVNSNTGYSVKMDTESGYKFATKIEKTHEELYSINSMTKAEAMWMASPCSQGGTYVMIVNGYGVVGQGSYNNAGSGSRPIVCLKSNVQLNKQADGTFKINN